MQRNVWISYLYSGKDGLSTELGNLITQ